MSHRTRGMDHSLYPYSPLPTRPLLHLPNGALVAVWVVLYLEHWEIATPQGSHRAPGVHGHWGEFFPDYRTYSYRQYGNRVGMFRVLECLDRYALPVTVAANSGALDRYPHLVEECLKRDWEIAAHGSYATRMITSAMGEEEERAVIDQSIRAVERSTGKRPSGWIGQDFSESIRTPQLVAEAGFKWLSDWPNDEQPYWMTVAPPLVSIPQQAEWDDVQLLWLRQIPMERYPVIIGDALERLKLDGSQNPRTLCLGIHPWLLGQAHRIRYLDAVLKQLASTPGVWLATGSAIASEFTRCVESSDLQPD